MTRSLTFPTRACLLLFTLPVALRADEQRTKAIVERLSRDQLDTGALMLALYEPPSFEMTSALKAAFTRSSSKEDKQLIAATLVELKEPDSQFFDYLAKEAADAIADDAPFMMFFDANGRFVRGKLNPEFESWCKQRGLSPNEQGKLQWYTYPKDVEMLARTREPRAAALLESGLDSPNFMLAIYAARGLGFLGKTDSVTHIVRTCERFPIEGRSTIAATLALFSSSEAKNAFERFVSDPKEQAGLRREAQQSLLECEKKRIGRLGGSVIRPGEKSLSK